MCESAQILCPTCGAKVPCTSTCGHYPDTNDLAHDVAAAKLMHTLERDFRFEFAEFNSTPYPEVI